MQDIPFDFWMFLAGLGIFLFGMRHLEEGIKGLAGKSFQNFIKRFTNRSWKGILTGTFVTAILQSSSMVTLLVLAFLGAGMLSLKNALGVVLGANLGTTFTAWIVAALGFKMNIADFSFPFLALGILSFLFLESRPFLKNLGVFLIGFGLLFLGLDYMKVALDTVADQIDLTAISQLGLWAFLLVGLVVTALVQSSSAMIVIILSALNSGLIDIYQSMAMIIGANIGTTSTLILGSIKGNADKKRLSLANVVFKIIPGVIIFIFLKESIDFIYNIFDVKDPLMELVLLNTLLNLFGIIIFLPFLGIIQKELNKRFKEHEPSGETLFIKNITTEFPEVALKAIKDELGQVYVNVQDFIQTCFAVSNGKQKASGWKAIFQTAVNLNDKYDKIKRLEDELTTFYLQLQEQNLTDKESEQLTSNMIALRSLVYGAKDIKDVAHNIKFIIESEDPLALEILDKLREFVKNKIDEIHQYVDVDATNAPTLNEMLESNEVFYDEMINFLYQNARGLSKKSAPVSTITNVIRQTVSSMNHICQAFMRDQINVELADLK
jgi:phosphate:Na+ symporter